MAELTLGAVSLIGPTYHLYKRCDALSKSYRNRHQDLQKCCHGLSLAKCLYLHELKTILGLLLSEDGLPGRMLDDITHPMWTDAQFVDKWEKVVGDRLDIALKVAEDKLKRIEEQLSRLAERLDRDATKTQPESGLGRIKRLKEDLFWSGRERREITALIDDLRKDHSDLRNLRKKLQDDVKSSPTLPPVKPPPSSDPTEGGEVMSRLVHIREVSNKLYETLADIANCGCHSVNLQLDDCRDAPFTPVASQILDSTSKSARFRLVFHHGDSSVCGTCQCTSVVIATELSNSKSGTSGNLSTSSTMVGPLYDHNPPIPVRVQYSDDGRIPIGIFFTLPDGRHASLSLLPQTTGPLSPSREVMTFLDVSPQPKLVSPQPRLANLCTIMDKLGSNSVTATKHLIATKNGTDCEYLIYREQLKDFRSTRRSLESILNSHLTERQLAKSERLQICLTLSISLLYFGSSPKSQSFFQERWRSRDIFFFEDVQASLSTTTPVSRGRKYIPHVVPRFKSDSRDNSDSGGDASARQIRVCPNDLLFSLAVVLIETAMNRSLFEIDPAYNYGLPGDAIAEFITVQQILNSGLLAKSLGARFTDVVRRCISCQFEDVHDYDMTKKDMQVNLTNHGTEEDTKVVLDSLLPDRSLAVERDVEAVQIRTSDALGNSSFTVYTACLDFNMSAVAEDGECNYIWKGGLHQDNAKFEYKSTPCYGLATT